MDRRTFLTAAGTAMLPLWYREQLQAQPKAEPPKLANDKPNIALIGCGGQGRGITRNAARFGNVVAVCDVDAGRAEQASKDHNGAKTYKDFRDLLKRDDIQIITNGTPDHWHTLVNLAAIKAGKDVYSEKPLTLTIDEGKRLVAAVEKSKRILQTGSQQRSDKRFRLACELVRNGRIGKVSRVTVILPAGLREGPFKSAEVPKGLDWDFWQGQTAARDYVPQRCHFSFRYWLDYSGGTMTDWGAHHNDIALWGLGFERAGPESVEGKLLSKPIEGGYTAPAEYEVEYVYPGGVVHRCISTTVNTVTGGAGRKPKEGERGHGVLFEGADGWIFVTRGKLESSRPEILSEELKQKKVELYVSDDHMGNFFECVRTRKQPVCDAEIGHRSASICHLGVIAIRLGRKLKWDAVKESFPEDKEAESYVAREQRKPWSYDSIG